MKREVFVRTPFNYDVDFASEVSGLVSDPETRTQQQFAEECDINTIVERFGLGYKMPEALRLPQYGDFTGLDSYHDAVNAIALAGESFDALPANVRTRFQNDPGQFVEFMMDDKNRDEAVKLGLLKSDAVSLPLTASLPNNLQAPVGGQPAVAPAVATAPVGAPAPTAGGSSGSA